MSFIDFIERKDCVRGPKGLLPQYGGASASCHPVAKPNKASIMDFVHDQLATGSKLRLLTVIDVFTR